MPAAPLLVALPTLPPRNPHPDTHPPTPADEAAQSYFVNLDRLINATNALQPGGLDGGQFKVFYSSPNEWTDAVTSNGQSFPLRTDDLMPYADSGHSYWGGYFTSRAALKGYIRQMTGVQTTARSLQVLSGGAPAGVGPENPLYTLERALAVAQHHDAVAGTSKQHVADDYARRLAAGMAAVDGLLGTAVAAVTGDASLAGALATCPLANVSICPPTEAAAGTVLLSVHNPQSANATVFVRHPVGFPAGVASWSVTDHAGNAVTAQVLPLSPADAALRARYGVANAANTQWLAFAATSVPAAGFAVYFLTPAAVAAGAPSTHFSAVRSVPRALKGGAPNSITNGVLTVGFDASTGRMASYTDAASGTSVALSQDIRAYLPSQGDGASGQCSGAYIFRPDGNATVDPSGTAAWGLDLVTGPVVSEARQTAGGPAAGWISSVARVWAGARDVEVEWTVGPIDVSNGKGYEVVSVVSVGDAATGAPWATGGAWRTDSNCRELQPRQRNARPSWNLTLSEPVAQNYVPVNCAAQLVDGATKAVLTVVVDRAQGGASLADGALEVMLHRRMTKDDGRGVGEALNEPGVDGQGLVVRGKHWLSVAPPTEAPALYRARWQTGLLGGGLLAAAALPAGTTPAAWLAAHKSSATALGAGPAGLPPNVHLMTLQATGPKALLVRLAHTFEAGEDAALSAPVTVPLATLVAGTTLTSCTELTLVASMPLADVKPVTYRIDGQAPLTLPVVPPAPAGAELAVTLGPMDIRTFACTTA